MNKNIFWAMILLIILGMFMVPLVAWAFDRILLLTFWTIPAFSATGLFFFLYEDDWKLEK